MMKCMILAAGKGKRLRPLTARIPKPLINITGKPLIEHHLNRLKASGYKEVVINLSHLGDMIQKRLGDGQRFGLNITYSHEGDEPLGTAGGITRALPLLGNEPFLVISGDIWCDHSLSFTELPHGKRAHLVLVDNPPHNPAGDFAYNHDKISNTGKNSLTFSGIGIYDPALFAGYPANKLALAPVLHTAVDNGLVSAEHFTGKWFDIGTPARLERAERYVARERRN